MPSLKDLRNRIASVKSTQKITKAMQMVAVSKLRRAQAAAEAARPYAEGRDGARQSRRRRAAGRDRRRRCSPAAAPTDASAGRLHRRARPLRRLQHLDRASGARAAPTRWRPPGKTVKILCVGKKGFDQLRRTHEKQILDMIDLRAVRTITFATAQPIAKRGDRDVRGRRVRRLHAVLRPLQVGDLADPDRAAADSRRARRATRKRPGLRLRARRGRDPLASCCRAR